MRRVLRSHKVKNQTCKIQGEAINFDFEIEKNAFAGFYSCGAWFNGEYYIIDGTLPGVITGYPGPGFLRKVKTRRILMVAMFMFIISACFSFLFLFFCIFVCLILFMYLFL